MQASRSILSCPVPSKEDPPNMLIGQTGQCPCLRMGSVHCSTTLFDVSGSIQVMGPQLPVPIDRFVLICPARVICFTCQKHPHAYAFRAISNFVICHRKCIELVTSKWVVLQWVVHGSLRGGNRGYPFHFTALKLGFFHFTATTMAVLHFTVIFELYILHFIKTNFTANIFLRSIENVLVPKIKVIGPTVWAGEAVME